MCTCLATKPRYKQLDWLTANNPRTRLALAIRASATELCSVYFIYRMLVHPTAVRRIIGIIQT